MWGDIKDLKDGQYMVRLVGESKNYYKVRRDPREPRPGTASLSPSIPTLGRNKIATPHSRRLPVTEKGLSQNAPVRGGLMPREGVHERAPRA